MASPEWLARISRRFVAVEQRSAALEKRLAAVEKKLTSRLPDPDGWERIKAYADREHVSIRTVDRDVERGVVEKRREPGTNRVYVRRVAPKPARKPRHRPGAVEDDGVAVEATAAPGAPIWPYGEADVEKEEGRTLRQARPSK